MMTESPLIAETLAFDEAIRFRDFAVANGNKHLIDAANYYLEEISNILAKALAEYFILAASGLDYDSDEYFDSNSSEEDL